MASGLIALLDDVVAIRRRVRNAGYAHIEGTMIPGLRASACPILDLQGRAILSATVLMPRAVPIKGDDDALAELIATCRGISARLGWQHHKKI